MTLHRPEIRSRRHLFNSNKSSLERAFEIAKSGQVSHMKDLAYRIRAEGYNVEQLQGRLLQKQLLQLIEAAR